MAEEKKQQNNFVKSFTPVWFATVLGFGGLALSTTLVAKLFKVSWLIPVAQLLVYFNFILFLYLFSVWLAKAIFYPRIFGQELTHQVVAGFHALMPAAMIMVAINFSKLGKPLSLWLYQPISIWFWSIGAIFEFTLLTVIIYFLVVNEDMHINFINGGWLVPPVAALLTPIAGLQILDFLSNISVIKSLLWINYFFFGTGAFIFLLIAVALFSKLFFFEKLDPKVFPSLWIILVPFSLMAISLSLFAKQTASFLIPAFKNPLMSVVDLINPMLIGAGLWLIILLSILTYHYFKKIELPYGAGWWAFVFPTASVSIASLNQAALLKDSFLANCGLAVYLFLLVIVTIVSVRTIKAFSPSPQQGKSRD